MAAATTSLLLSSLCVFATSSWCTEVEWLLQCDCLSSSHTAAHVAVLLQKLAAACAAVLMQAWLDPLNLPTAEQLTCGVTGRTLQFLLQVYCPVDDNPVDAFHRAIFLFVSPRVSSWFVMSRLAASTSSSSSAACRLRLRCSQFSLVIVINHLHHTADCICIAVILYTVWWQQLHNKFSLFSVSGFTQTTNIPLCCVACCRRAMSWPSLARCARCAASCGAPTPSTATPQRQPASWGPSSCRCAAGLQLVPAVFANLYCV